MLSINSYGLNISLNPKTSTNEVLGYKVDKDGYFTEEFNKATGIPQDYKIHSSTMQNLVKSNTNGTFQSYKNIDIAKTIGNAYKIVSQLLEKSPELAFKESFSQEDLANYFPQNYKINKQSGEIKEVYLYEEVEKIVANGGFKNVSTNEAIVQSFFDMDNAEGSALKPFDTNILSNGNFEINAKQYTDENGNLTKAGLLVGFLSKNSNTGITTETLIAGETTIWGKIQGLDNSLGESEINNLRNQLNGTLDLSRFGELIEVMNGTDINAFKEKISELKNPQNTKDTKNILELIEETLNQHLKFLLNNENKAITEKRLIDIKA